MAGNRAVQLDWDDERKHRLELARAVNLLFSGRINATGAFTALAATTSTVVSDPLCFEDSVPVLTPANAAASGLGYYVSNRQRGSFTVTHAAPGGNASFLYALLG